MELSCSKEAQIFRSYHEKRRRKLGEVHHQRDSRRYSWKRKTAKMTPRNGHILSTEEALQLTKDRAAWRSTVHHAANVRASE